MIELVTGGMREVGCNLLLLLVTELRYIRAGSVTHPC